MSDQISIRDSHSYHWLMNDWLLLLKALGHLGTVVLETEFGVVRCTQSISSNELNVTEEGQLQIGNLKLLINDLKSPVYSL